MQQTRQEKVISLEDYKNKLLFSNSLLPPIQIIKEVRQSPEMVFISEEEMKILNDLDK